MEYRELGRTGLRLSELGLGTWAMGSDWGEQPVKASIDTIHAAIRNGINFLDTAAGYGSGRSEQVIAKALRSGTKSDVIIATKVHPTMPGEWPPSPYCELVQRYPESYLEKSLTASLRNLGVDCIDLYQFHTWTRAWNSDPHVFEWVEKKKKEGKIRFIGVSTPEHDQHAVLDLMRDGYVDTVQIIYNIFEQEPAAQLIPEARRLGVGVICRCVFDEGSLAGAMGADRVFDPGDFRNRYFEGDRLARTVVRTDQINHLIAHSKYSIRDHALRFVLDNHSVCCALAGARSEAQLLANVKSVQMPPLTEETTKALRRFNWRKGFWYEGK
jgi:aryl-alcohol dehydrogenase-like predicted oxidoreductase